MTVAEPSAQSPMTVHPAAASVGHSVAIFASRETPAVLDATIAAATRAVAQAGSASGAVIDVLVNGNTALADAVVQLGRARAQRAGTQAPRLRIWQLALADKAHAWNQYVEAIWPGSEVAFFVDGYVRLWPSAIERLSQRLRLSADAIAATGVPTVGRSAAAARRTMLAEGGIQGNCFCIAGSALRQMREMGFRLPLGLYRGDAMIGAVLAYRLDPMQHQWDAKGAVLVEPTASWDMQATRWWHLADWRALFRRRDRQAQGTLENLATREHLTLRRLPPQALPATAAELVLGWAGRCPDAATAACRRSGRAARALANLRSPRDWSLAAVAPTLVADSAA